MVGGSGCGGATGGGGPRAGVGYGIGCGVCAPVAVMSFSLASCRRFLFVVASAGVAGAMWSGIDTGWWSS